MQKYEINQRRAIWIFAAFTACCFLPFLGGIHLFDWDEINFSEIAREMVISGNYTEPRINFQPFTEKPPLFTWLQALSMHVFGINEFSARFPNAILSFFTLWLLFQIGSIYKNARFGFLWAMAYGCTILPHLYFKSAIIDPWFNFFIFFSLYGLIMAANNKKRDLPGLRWLIIGGVMCGLAILTKGPTAILLIGLSGAVFTIFNKFKLPVPPSQVLIFILVALATAGIWFLVDWLLYGPKFIIEFTIRQWELLTTPDAGHRGFLFYHFIVLFFGCFPVSALLFMPLFGKNEENEGVLDLAKWMKVLFWVVLILFSLVQTKIVHYSSMCYFPMTFMGALYLERKLNQNGPLAAREKWLLVIASLPFIIAPPALVYLTRHKELLASMLARDPFALGNIQAEVHWTGWEWLPALIMIMTLSVFFRWSKQKVTRTSIIILLSGTALFVQSSLYLLVSKIEGYTQRAHIEFWQTTSGMDCYRTTYHFKSYAPYFYGEVMPQNSDNYTDQNWLFQGPVDKPVYIATKVTSRESLEAEIQDAVFLYSKNGFFFYKRNAVKIEADE